MKIEDATKIMYGFEPPKTLAERTQKKYPVITHEAFNYSKQFDRPRDEDAEEDFYVGFEKAVNMIAERLAYTHGKQLADQIKQEFLVIEK
jgi:hypothetical protein